MAVLAEATKGGGALSPPMGGTSLAPREVEVVGCRSTHSVDVSMVGGVTPPTGFGAAVTQSNFVTPPSTTFVGTNNAYNHDSSQYGMGLSMYPSETSSPSGQTAAIVGDASGGCVVGEFTGVEAHVAAQSSNISGATTPTEGGEVPMLRFRKQDRQDVKDSRIMKLIGRRSVLRPDGMFTTLQPRGEDRQQRCAPLRQGQPPGSPASRPSALVRQPLLKSSIEEAPSPLSNQDHPRLSDMLRGSTGKLVSEQKRRISRGVAGVGMPASPADSTSLGGNREASPEEYGAQLRQGVRYSEEWVASPGAGDNILPKQTNGVHQSLHDHGASGEVPSFGGDGGVDELDCVGDTADGADEGSLNSPSFGLTAADRSAALCAGSEAVAADNFDRKPNIGLAADPFPCQGEASLGGFGALQPPVASGHDSLGHSEGFTDNADFLHDLGGNQDVQGELGAATEDLSGSQGALIWPGRPTAASDVATDAMAAAYAHAGAAALLSGGAAHYGQQCPIELPVLQNEIGSLVVPHTWRFVPPPSVVQVLEATPEGEFQGATGHVSLLPCVAGGVPSGSQDAASPGGDALAFAAPSEGGGGACSSKDAPEAASVGSTLDVYSKRRLLDTVLGALSSQSGESDKALRAEQRANRAMRVTLEVLHRQNVCLQQQLAWVTQSWPQATACWAPGEDGSMQALQTAEAEAAAAQIAAAAAAVVAAAPA